MYFIDQIPSIDLQPNATDVNNYWTSFSVNDYWQEKYILKNGSLQNAKSCVHGELLHVNVLCKHQG